ncbi:MAG: hypothetical protein MZW92_57275 [Comamonadaceae bacterium]|nr:hypothetical protein [Comamonadaceae bacterium]
MKVTAPARAPRARSLSRATTARSRPARPPAPASPPATPRCVNGDCYRTYDNGRKVRFQARQTFQPVHEPVRVGLEGPADPRRHNAPATTTALICDDEPLMRANLREHLERLWPELRIVGEAADGAQALQLLQQLQPDVALSRHPDAGPHRAAGRAAGRPVDAGGVRHRLRQLRSRRIRGARSRLPAQAAGSGAAGEDGREAASAGDTRHRCGVAAGPGAPARGARRSRPRQRSTGCRSTPGARSR